MPRLRRHDAARRLAATPAPAAAAPAAAREPNATGVIGLGPSAVPVASVALDRGGRGADVAAAELDRVHDERRDLVQRDALAPSRGRAGRRRRRRRSTPRRSRRRGASSRGRTRGGRRARPGSISQFRPRGVDQPVAGPEIAVEARRAARRRRRTARAGRRAAPSRVIAGAGSASRVARQASRAAAAGWSRRTRPTSRTVRSVARDCRWCAGLRGRSSARRARCSVGERDAEVGLGRAAPARPSSIHSSTRWFGGVVRDREDLGDRDRVRGAQPRQPGGLGGEEVGRARPGGSSRTRAGRRRDRPRTPPRRHRREPASRARCPRRGCVRSRVRSAAIQAPDATVDEFRSGTMSDLFKTGAARVPYARAMAPRFDVIGVVVSDMADLAGLLPPARSRHPARRRRVHRTWRSRCPGGLRRRCSTPRRRSARSTPSWIAAVGGSSRRPRVRVRLAGRRGRDLRGAGRIRERGPPRAVGRVLGSALRGRARSRRQPRRAVRAAQRSVS